MNMELELTTVLHAKRAFIAGRTVAGGVAVVVRAGRIERVLAGVASGIDVEVGGPRVVHDLGDRTLLPGLIDAHTHFLGIATDHYDSLLWERLEYRTARAAGEARRLLMAGVTSTRDLGSPCGPALSRAIRDGHLEGPRIIAAGESLCATNGTWDIVAADRSVADLHAMLVDGGDNLRRAVRDRVRSGALVIKIGLSRGRATDHSHGWGDDPSVQEVAYTDDEIRAVVDEAHRSGVKVSAHCIGDGPVRSALRNGVDVIEHGFGIDDETRRMIVDAGRPVVTTISGLALGCEASARRGDDPLAVQIQHGHLARMRADFEAGRAAGVTYVLGSDLIGDPDQPQTAAIGEFARVVEWGMSPVEALIAGTTAAADVLGLGSSIGALEPGMAADVIACPGDPASDIRELGKVDLVMSDGVIRRHDRAPQPQWNQVVGIAR
jgi:imidazolonepropionase-like amidohydrolase